MGNFSKLLLTSAIALGIGLSGNAMARDGDGAAMGAANTERHHSYRHHRGH